MDALTVSSSSENMGITQQSNTNNGRDTSIVIDCPTCKTVIWAGYGCKKCMSRKMIDTVDNDPSIDLTPIETKDGEELPKAKAVNPPKSSKRNKPKRHGDEYEY